MYKFNNHDIITGYIKELLLSFNLPQIHVITKNTVVFPGHDYIYKNKIYKYKGTTVETITNTNALPSTLKEINNYVFGQSMLNITKNLILKSNIYDTYTHEYLGDYLRFIRDYLDFNLMSMYNCFSNRIARYVNVKVYNSTFDSNDTSHKIYAVPVKFFNEYTIGIDCDSKIEMFCGFYQDGMISVSSSLDNDFYSSTYTQRINTRFKKPFLYSKLKNMTNINNLQYGLESQLFLFIKVSTSCNSSVTVLEGNYLDNCEHYFDEDAERVSNVPLLYKFKDETTGKIGDELTRYKFISRLQLFNFNSGISTPFADRLVEYLFGNVVSSVDDIGENVLRVQKILMRGTTPIKLRNVDKYGEWSENLRKNIYANEIHLGIVHKALDVLGFYDKDIEGLLGE
jgi:hypothetical protein